MADYHLVTKREADLLAAILSNLNPAEDAGIADAILCDLIDLGLSDAWRGPAVFKLWLKLDDLDFMTGDPSKPFKTLVAEYVKTAEDY